MSLHYLPMQTPEGFYVVAYKQPGVEVYVAVCDCLTERSAKTEAGRLNALSAPREEKRSPIVRAKRPPGARDNLQPQLF